jgi:hypothetical protein
LPGGGGTRFRRPFFIQISQAKDRDMADDTRPPSAASRDTARRRGQTHFATPELREDAFRAEVHRERKASDAKTAKLRTLRLAKEEQDRIDAANAPPPPPKKTRSKKPPATSA